MANPDAAYGLRPTRMISGGPFCGQVVTCAVASATGNLFVGSPVALSGTAITFTSGSCIGTYPAVAGAAAAGPVFGVIVGIEPDRGNLGNVYSLTGTDRLVRVAVATPDVVFVCQEDSDSVTLALADSGQFVDLVNPTSGSTTTGYSTTEIDSSTSGAGGGTSWRLLNPYNVENNAIGAQCQWEIVCVEPQIGLGTVAAEV